MLDTIIEILSWAFYIFLFICLLALAWFLFDAFEDDIPTWAYFLFSFFCLSFYIKWLIKEAIEETVSSHLSDIKYSLTNHEKELFNKEILETLKSIDNQLIDIHDDLK